MEIVVVGVDGSEGADAALAFAAKEAALRMLPLRVVCAWEIPMVDLSISTMASSLDAVAEALKRDAGEIARRAMERAIVFFPSLASEGKVVEGQAAAVLVREAEDAVLLVVGRRGRGGFAELLVGRVTMQVVQHARCPVAVVRGATG